MLSLRLRPTTSADLAFVCAAEQHPDNQAFILPWAEQQHQAALDDPDLQHLILEHTETQARVGFVMLANVTNTNQSIEFRRLVVTEKGHGYGRVAVQLVKALVFGPLGAHRLWLDVKAHNQRAQQLYLTELFVVEGLLRECLKSDDGYDSLVVMSILRQEYNQALS